MSVPDTKAFPPAPRRTNTRSAASSSTRSHAAESASYIAQVIAFRTSGRLKVRNATGGSISKIVSAGIGYYASRAMASNRTGGALTGLRVLDVTQVMAG